LDFSNLQKEHGDLITLKIFGKTVIVVCGYDTIKEVMVKNGETTVNHPETFVLKEFFKNSGKKRACLGASPVNQ
jgi:hypothetical protein